MSPDFGSSSSLQPNDPWFVHGDVSDSQLSSGFQCAWTFLLHSHIASRLFLCHTLLTPNVKSARRPATRGGHAKRSLSAQKDLMSFPSMDLIVGMLSWTQLGVEILECSRRHRRCAKHKYLKWSPLWSMLDIFRNIEQERYQQQPAKWH